MMELLSQFNSEEVKVDTVLSDREESGDEDG